MPCGIVKVSGRWVHGTRLKGREDMRFSRIVLAALAPVAIVGLHGSAEATAGNQPISIIKVCRAQYGTAVAAKLIRPDAYGWACLNNRGDLLGGVDLNAWCAATNPGTIAVYRDFDVPNSWSCVSSTSSSSG